MSIFIMRISLLTLVWIGLMSLSLHHLLNFIGAITEHNEFDDGPKVKEDKVLVDVVAQVLV